MTGLLIAALAIDAITWVAIAYTWRTNRRTRRVQREINDRLSRMGT